MSKYSMNKNLPPLNALITFEAAARLNSFKLAAEALHQTPAAVAYQIRKLEQALKITLFDRFHRGVELNAAGQQYYTIITHSLNDLANHTRQFKLKFGQSSLTVLTLHAIAEKWLMPRLIDFRKRFPSINIEIKATDNLDITTANDIVIGFSLTEPNQNLARIFLEEEIFPVCSAGYLKKAGHLPVMTQLSEQDLLFDAHWKQDWRLWLKLNDIPARLDQNSEFSFSLYSMVIEAAIGGLGIMMGHKALIEKELRDGTLIRIFEDTKPLKGYYYLNKNKQDSEDELTDQFQDWIRQQA